jgi:peptide-methionine (S)-S-oxide reductase
MRGVTRCLVGYTGGVEPDPTYQSIQDYTEALLIEYDATICTLKDVLNKWKSMATPYPSKRQYRTALWYLSDDQEREMKEFVDEMPQGKYVDVEKATRFFMAEEYHQNFLAKQTSMFR